MSFFFEDKRDEKGCLLKYEAMELGVKLAKHGKEILSKYYYDSSDIINFGFCQKLIEKHKKEYCDTYLIWNLISLQIFLRKHKF